MKKIFLLTTVALALTACGQEPGIKHKPQPPEKESLVQPGSGSHGLPNIPRGDLTTPAEKTFNSIGKLPTPPNKQWPASKLYVANVASPVQIGTLDANGIIDIKVSAEKARDLSIPLDKALLIASGILDREIIGEHNIQNSNYCNTTSYLTIGMPNASGFSLAGVAAAPDAGPQPQSPDDLATAIRMGRGITKYGNDSLRTFTINQMGFTYVENAINVRGSIRCDDERIKVDFDFQLKPGWNQLRSVGDIEATKNGNGSVSRKGQFLVTNEEQTNDYRSTWTQNELLKPISQTPAPNVPKPNPKPIDPQPTPVQPAVLKFSSKGQLNITPGTEAVLWAPLSGQAQPIGKLSASGQIDVSVNNTQAQNWSIPLEKALLLAAGIKNNVLHTCSVEQLSLSDRGQGFSLAGVAAVPNGMSNSNLDITMRMGNGLTKAEKNNQVSYELDQYSFTYVDKPVKANGTVLCGTGQFISFDVDLKAGWNQLHSQGVLQAEKLNNNELGNLRGNINVRSIAQTNQYNGRWSADQP